MDRGAWQATVHGVARVGHDLATKERERISSVTACCCCRDGWNSHCVTVPKSKEWTASQLNTSSPRQEHPECNCQCPRVLRFLQPSGTCNSVTIPAVLEESAYFPLDVFPVSSAHVTQIWKCVHLGSPFSLFALSFDSRNSLKITDGN